MTICNFTDRYKEFDWITSSDDLNVLDFTTLSGCSGYCDEEAGEVIRSAVSKVPLMDTFYLDNGNYHYVSYFRSEMIKEDFDLLLIDHHTDAQEPQFPLLSCGSWVLWCLKNNVHLKDVYMIGPSEEKMAEIPDDFRRKIHLLDEKDACAEGLPRKDKIRALFLSIDLDVLSPEYFTSVWDQGDMSPDTLKHILNMILHEDRICAIDICG